MKRKMKKESKKKLTNWIKRLSFLSIRGALIVLRLVILSLGAYEVLFEDFNKGVVLMIVACLLEASDALSEINREGIRVKSLNINVNGIKEDKNPTKK